MLTMDVRHPDIEKFIQIKKDLTKVTGANISVMLRDDFMTAVNEDKDYILRWPCTMEYPEQVEYNLNIDYNTIQILQVAADEIHYYKKVKAKQIWDKLIDAAHASAEPGIMYVDKHWDYSPDTVYDRYKGITTNP